MGMVARAVGVVGVLVLIGMCSSKEKYTVSEPTAPPSISSNPLSHDSASVVSAKKIMENTRELANVYTEGGHLVVEFNQRLFPNDEDRRLKFICAVADADHVLNSKKRSIFYYNPGGKLIGKADSVNGVKLR